MSGSTRRKVHLYVTAFFGILFATLTIYAAWDLGKDRGAINRDQEIKSAHKPAEANDQIKKRCFVGNQSIESTVNCIKTESEPYQKNSREQQDLDAQKQMALWAKGMFVATLGTLAVTGLGVFLVGLTLRHTRRAADYAKDMVDEARETTKAAWETVRSDRAWITIENITPIPNANAIINGEIVDRLIVFIVGFKNCGRSPAKRFESFSSYKTATTNSAIPNFDEDWNNIEGRIGSIIAPGQIVFSGQMPLMPKHYSLLRERQLRVFIYAKARYTDIYSADPRETEVCLEVIHQGFATNDRGERIDSFGFHPIGPQNTAT